MRAVSKKRARLNRIRRKLVQPILTEGRPCEAQFVGCSGAAVDPHEVKTRARGGSIIDQANIVFLCRFCHDLITGESNWAVRHGWVVSSWATPEEETDAWAIRHLVRCPVICPIDHRDLVA